MLTPTPFALDVYGVMVLNDNLIFNVYRPPTYFYKIKIKHSTSSVYYMNLMAFEMHIRRESITDTVVSSPKHSCKMCMDDLLSKRASCNKTILHIYIQPQNNNIR